MNVRLLSLTGVFGAVLGCHSYVEIDSGHQPLVREDLSQRDVRHRSVATIVLEDDLSIIFPPKCLSLEGVYVASGYMGDAARPGGPLRRRIRRDEYRTAPSCEEWTYSPTDANSAQRWCGVAYQYPANNWGDAPGKDLSAMGFTRVTFWAKSGSSSPIEVMVKSGGLTRLGAKYPASYLVERMITVTDQWEKFSLPIRGLDHSCVASALAIALSADGGSAQLLIDDVVFEGP